MLLLLTTAKFSEFFKLMFLETIKVYRWSVFPNPVTFEIPILTFVLLTDYMFESSQNKDLKSADSK